MSKVQIDDYYCDNCNKTGLAELDTRRIKYICLMCGREEVEVKNENIL